MRRTKKLATASLSSEAATHDGILAAAINAARSLEDRDRKRRIYTAASRRRDLSVHLFFYFLLPLLSSLSLSIFLSRALRGKPPAETRRAAIREWNIIARAKDKLFGCRRCAACARMILSRSLSKLCSLIRFSLKKNDTFLGRFFRIKIYKSFLLFSKFFVHIIALYY